MTDQERIELALKCRDCARIAKVPDAGYTDSCPEGEYQIMHNGLRLFCDSHYGTYNVEVIRGLLGHHEPQEEAAFHDVIKRIPPGSVILELGSFWAYYSLWFLDQVPEGRAILVEPFPSALEAGRRNFRFNDAEGCFVHAAIGSVPKSEAPVELWKDMVVSVPTISVDSLLKTKGLKHLAILHADIQGHELSMLEGAAEALTKKRIDWIFISTHGENIHQRCLRVLKKAGYSIAADHTPSESYSIDGLVVASRFTGIRFPISKRRSRATRISKARSKIRINILEPLGLKPITS